MKNFWTGEWLSLWKLTKADEGYYIQGNIRSSSYYYEDGNVQFKMNNDFEETIKGYDEDADLAQEVVNIINNKEDRVNYSVILGSK